MSFTLKPTARGTHVERLHSDLPELRVPGHADGWAHFLPRLVSIAEGETLPPDGWIPLLRQGGRVTGRARFGSAGVTS